MNVDSWSTVSLELGRSIADLRCGQFSGTVLILTSAHTRTLASFLKLAGAGPVRRCLLSIRTFYGCEGPC